MRSLSPSRRVQVLRDSVARKIAAGEVIDRPHAVVRELMDNAIDAGSTAVTVSIEGGGITAIRVTDNGWGMTKEDLQTCCLPHATSKIETVEDIYEIASLGFRGEALSSIAACAKLAITSVREAEPNGWKIDQTSFGNVHISAAKGTPGTVVETRDLFFDLPGRRKFLKKPQSEATMIRQVFLEKALPFPHIWFRFFSDGELKINLPAGSQMERVVSAYPSQLDARLLFELDMPFDTFRVRGVFSNPSHFRRDRRYIHVYVNNRRVSEFALIQAVEYGFSAYLPGGSYPIGFLFLDIEPQLVDFNIHPAKREVKFKSLQEIHRGVVGTIQQALRQGEIPNIQEYRRNSESVKGPEFPDLRHTGAVYRPKETPGTNKPERDIVRETIRERLRAGQETGAGAEQPHGQALQTSARTMVSVSAAKGNGSDNLNFSYIGQLFNLFLLFEYDKTLYVLDQHAAHERIIYDRLLAAQPVPQPLLLPVSLSIEAISGEHQKALKEMGIEITATNGEYVLSAVPDFAARREAEIASFIEGTSGTEHNLKARLYADIACKKAIKDGEALDKGSAEHLIAQSLALPEPRCPHGRPVWFTLTREELFQLLGRT